MLSGRYQLIAEISETLLTAEGSFQLKCITIKPFSSSSEQPTQTTNPQRTVSRPTNVHCIRELLNNDR
eukprot:6476759-Amphidinium_carterae.2